MYMMILLVNLDEIMHVVRVMHHGVRALFQFWCVLVLWWGLGVSSRFQVGISETLPMMVVMIWCALVQWD